MTRKTLNAACFFFGNFTKKSLFENFLQEGLFVVFSRLRLYILQCNKIVGITGYQCRERFRLWKKNTVDAINTGADFCVAKLVTGFRANQYTFGHQAGQGLIQRYFGQPQLTAFFESIE